MLVKFNRDFQGKATREVFYKQGQEVELEEAVAEALVAEGVAEIVVTVSKGAKVDAATVEVKPTETFEAAKIITEPHPVDEPIEEETQKPKKRGRK